LAANRTSGHNPTVAPQAFSKQSQEDRQEQKAKKNVISVGFGTLIIEPQ